MTKDPAFLMYSKDWLEGTAEYMPDEKGVYIDLLCHQHQKGGLPTDLDRLARMVGLSNGNFQKIWKIISCHFEQENNRLVNRKLQVLMDERREKSKLNTITGTFAGLIRLGNYTAKEYKHLKANFKPSDFIKYTKDELNERLTEWLVLCLKSIGNEDVIVFEDNIEDLYKGVVIFFDEDLRPKDQKDKNRWLDTLEKLIRIDGKNPELITQVIKKTRMDDFWKDKFLSITKLREKDKSQVQYFLRFEKLFTGEIKSEDTVTRLRREMKEIEARQNGNKQ